MRRAGATACCTYGFGLRCGSTPGGGASALTAGCTLDPPLAGGPMANAAPLLTVPVRLLVRVGARAAPAGLSRRRHVGGPARARLRLVTAHCLALVRHGTTSQSSPPWAARLATLTRRATKPSMAPGVARIGDDLRSSPGRQMLRDDAHHGMRRHRDRDTMMHGTAQAHSEEHALKSRRTASTQSRYTLARRRKAQDRIPDAERRPARSGRTHTRVRCGLARLPVRRVLGMAHGQEQRS